MLIIRKFTVFTALFCGLSVAAQDHYINLSDSILKSNMENTKKVLLIDGLLAKETIAPLTRAEIYYEYSKWNWRNKDQAKAKECAKRERAIRKEDSTAMAKVKRNLYNLGYMHHHSSYPDYDNALAYFDTLITVSPSSEVRVGNAYREKGDIYESLGDSQKAFENYTYSELIFKETGRPDLRVKTLINIAANYAGRNEAGYLGDFRENLIKIEGIDPRYVSNRQQGMLSLNSSAMYYTAKEYTEALQWAEKALVLFQEENDSAHVFNSFNLLGISQKKLKNLKESESLFDQAALFARDPLQKSIVSNNIADVYLEKEQYEKAITYYIKAISILIGAQNREDEPLPIVYDNLGVSPYKVRLFGYLNDLTNAYVTYWEHAKDREILEKANEFIIVADKLVDDLFRESSEELSKLHWRERSANLYINGIAIAHALNMPEKALYYMEKNKGLLLLEHITNVSARQKADIPMDVVNKEYSLLSRIKKLEFQWAGKEIPDSSKREIFQLKQDYGKLIDSLNTRFPSYFKFKKRLSIASLDEIQKKLKENEVVISYTMDSEKVYMAYLTQAEISLKVLPLTTSQLNEEVDQLLKQLSQPFHDTEAIANYQERSAKLFQDIFPLNNKENQLFGKTVFIVPDGSLYKIPFEALSTSLEAPLEASYFLNRSTVSYKYSLSVENQLEHLNQSQYKNTVGFFPGEFKNGYQDPLLRSSKEQSLLAGLLDAHVFDGDLASKTAFLEAYDSNSVIHVSTHGGIEERGPWLAFYDEPLFLNDLYFLKNQKELVVLSACKTSTGDVKKGEGIFSLTRGFINAGAKSIVSTLWDVNEKTSLEITSSFYEYLKQGDSKAEALRKAKLEYLGKYKNTSESSPYYWSAIILTGNDQPLYPASFLAKNRIGLLLGLLVVFLVGFWVKRTRKNS